MCKMIQTVFNWLYYFKIFSTDKVYFNHTLEELVQLWVDNDGPLSTTGHTIAFLDFDNDTSPEIEITTSLGLDVDEYSNFYCS